MTVRMACGAHEYDAAAAGTDADVKTMPAVAAAAGGADASMTLTAAGGLPALTHRCRYSWYCARC